MHSSSEGTLRCKFSAGKPSTTASVVRPMKTAKREKRIVMEIGMWRLEVRLECLAS